MSESTKGKSSIIGGAGGEGKEDYEEVREQVRVTKFALFLYTHDNALCSSFLKIFLIHTHTHSLSLFSFLLHLGNIRIDIYLLQI